MKGWFHLPWAAFEYQEIARRRADLAILLPHGSVWLKWPSMFVALGEKWLLKKPNKTTPVMPDAVGGRTGTIPAAQYTVNEQNVWFMTLVSF